MCLTSGVLFTPFFSGLLTQITIARVRSMPELTSGQTVCEDTGLVTNVLAVEGDIVGGAGHFHDVVGLN
jgi:hypothetical protein